LGSSPIKIFVNGDLETNIVSLLEILNISSKHIAIEINESLIFRSDWEKTNLKDEDKVEIVKAIGGG
jgi:thiamine biosynthesis protein ThiS